MKQLPSMQRVPFSQREDRGSVRFFIYGFLIVSIAASIDWYSSPKHFGSQLYIAGFFLISGAGIWWHSKDKMIKRAKRKEILTRRDITDEGLFRWIRHPCYLGVILMLAGIAVFFRSGYGFLAFLAMVLVALYRMHVVEKALVLHYGKQYADYQKRTKKIIPGMY